MEKKPLKTPMGTGMNNPMPRGQMNVQDPMATRMMVGKPMVSRRQPTAAPMSAQPKPKPKLFDRVAKKVVNKARAQAGAAPLGQGQPGKPKRGMY